LNGQRVAFEHDKSRLESDFLAQLNEQKSRYSVLEYNDPTNARLQQDIEALHLRIQELNKLIVDAEAQLALEIDNRHKREHEYDLEAKRRIEEERNQVQLRFDKYMSALELEI